MTTSEAPIPTVQDTTAEAGTPRAPKARRRQLLLPVLGIALAAICVVAAGVGSVDIGPGRVITTLLHGMGWQVGSAPDQLTESVIWDIRLPRVVLGVLVGASLATAGAIMQGAFRNPLAEPALIGVSAGAAVGAVLSIVAGFTALGAWTTPAAAFVAGLLTVAAVYALARDGHRTEVITLVLAGIAVNAFMGALIGLGMFVSDDAELRSITFWNLGSMAQATWPKVAVVAPIALVGLAAAPRFARGLDLLGLGEDTAEHLGVNTESLRRRVMVVVALLTAAAVAVAGIIAFVGLVVPHIIRLIAGPGHRLLIPACALGGAVAVVLADTLARTIAAPAEIPLGVLTALVGSPVFFVLIRHTRRTHGGWA